MPRRSGFSGLITTTARIAARREREQIKQRRDTQRAAERARKQEIKLRAQADKDAKQRYLESRMQETEDLNKELTHTISELSNILEHTLTFDDTISFDSLRIHDKFPELELPPELQKEPAPTTREEYFSKISKPSAIDRLIPGWERRYQKKIEEAEKRFKEYQEKFEAFVSKRNIKIAELQENFNKERQTFDINVQQKNQEVDEFENAYKSGDPTAITAYYSMVLERSDFPDRFPQEFRIAYVPEPKELVIEYELPNRGIIPPVAEFKYTKTKDSIDEKTRKASEIKDLYQDVVSAVCLRTIHEVLEADQANHIDVVVFNGFVNDTDPATGRDIRPCLISVRTTKDKFLEINLAKVDRKACLRNLGAQVSSRPDELLAVKPIIEFDMVDKRFVEESDILTDLESRPNLMELTPFEFENLVNNLFDRIGFDAKSTQASRDGGVDVVAFDPRPILGGKVVIQAKRYKNVVGVSAVRDLYGTMINEGANKGILVTTSHYGKDAYEFAKDKPIELIDGGGLLYLLEQNGIRARIIFPEE
ncbi:MAG: restriction endonuclease [Anaerolineae bacterium]|nr:restriction endonuclease [Anaerolineae bacterium]